MSCPARCARAAPGIQGRARQVLEVGEAGRRERATVEFQFLKAPGTPQRLQARAGDSMAPEGEVPEPGHRAERRHVLVGDPAFDPVSFEYPQCFQLSGIEQWKPSRNPETGTGKQRPRVSLRERLGRKGQVHQQQPEVGARAERVESILCAKRLRVAVAHRDGAAQSAPSQSRPRLRPEHPRRPTQIDQPGLRARRGHTQRRTRRRASATVLRRIGPPPAGYRPRRRRGLPKPGGPGRGRNR